MNQQQRINDALRNGYIMSFLRREDDQATDLWSRIASRHKFPFVAVSPEPTGVVVTFLLGDDARNTDRTITRARELATRTCANHLGSTVEAIDVGIGIMAGPLPIEPATELAVNLARITGAVFPITGYDEE